MKACLFISLIFLSLQAQAYLTNAAIRDNCIATLKAAVAADQEMPADLKNAMGGAMMGLTWLKNPSRWPDIETLGDLNDMLEKKKSKLIAQKEFLEKALKKWTGNFEMEEGIRQKLAKVSGNIAHFEEAIAATLRKSAGMAARMGAKLNNSMLPGGISTPDGKATLPVGDLKGNIDDEIKAADRKIQEKMVEIVTPDGVKYMPRQGFTVSELEEVAETIAQRKQLVLAQRFFNIHNFPANKSMVEALEQITARGYQGGLKEETEAAEYFLRGKILASGKSFLGASAKVLIKGLGATLGVAIAAVLELSGIMHVAEGLNANEMEDMKDIYEKDPARIYAHLKTGTLSYERVCGWGESDPVFGSVLNEANETLFLAAGKPPPQAILSTSLFKNRDAPPNIPTAEHGRGAGPGRTPAQGPGRSRR